jgi:hypothetical protein
MHLSSIKSCKIQANNSFQDMNREWANKYWDFLMSKDDDSAFSLKAEHFPNSFFKYRDLSKRTIQNISANTIWLAEIASLNDPFECSLQFDNDECLRVFFSDSLFYKNFKDKFGIELTKSEIEGIITSNKPYHAYEKLCITKNIILNTSADKQLQLALKRWDEIIEETNQNIRICSFSELNDSLLLWSHYADEHKGICIEYDLLEEGEVRPFLQPIIYSEKIYKIATFEELTTLRKIGSTLIKCKDWEYEAEWRLTLFKRNDILPNTITISKPKSVYLGTRFHLNDEILKKQLFKILEEREIPVFQMTKHSEKYKLITLNK